MTRLVRRGSSRSATWSGGISSTSTTFRAADPRDSQRDRSRAAAGRQPGAVRARSATGWGWSQATWSGLFVGHNFALKGLKPLLRGAGRQRSRRSGPRPIHLLVCGGGELARFAGWRIAWD